jgi:hypothetical protein
MRGELVPETGMVTKIHLGMPKLKKAGAKVIHCIHGTIIFASFCA